MPFKRRLGQHIHVIFEYLFENNLGSESGVNVESIYEKKTSGQKSRVTVPLIDCCSECPIEV
jgi:hypothetical protein